MNLQEFVGKMAREPANDATVTVYRGHANRAYTLKPNVFRRTPYIENEHVLLRELVAMHPDQFATDQSTLEMLVRMQHYSLPTRLLDVSWNPLVALYFAAQPKRTQIRRKGAPGRDRFEADGEVVRLVVDKALVRYFDSDTVSLLANLARCDPGMKADIRRLVSTARDDDAGKEAFNGEKPVKRLLHFVRGEKPAFDPDIVPSDLSRTLLVKPKLSNRRILAQEGCFFVFGLVEEMRPTGVPGVRVERIRIPADDKLEILAALSRVAVNERTMFPEIERAAKYLTDGLSTTAILSRSI
ncbi:MAG: FRG domain-containing protein [Pseudomonadota bacterium]